MEEDPIQIDVRRAIHSLSDALDLVGIDERYHGKRVAFMAVECGKTMGWDDTLLNTIYSASLLHDCGVSSTQVHRSLVTELDWSGSQVHCERGEALLSKCRLFEGLPPIIRYHHTHWDDLPADLDPTVAMMSNLIYMTDRVDASIAHHQGVDILISRHAICKTIQNYRGNFFAGELVDAFLAIAAREFFWLNLEPGHLAAFISDMESSQPEQFSDHRALLEVAAIFADIVDAKSPFTAEHSRGVAQLARHLGVLLGLPEHTRFGLEAAGLLHDLGKLNVPDEILEKPGPLSEEERAVIMRHSFESYQILRKILGFQDIALWAACHHECPSGAGYPFHRNRRGLSLEALIIAVADVFQALVQNRPYRDSMPLDRALGIMSDMAKAGRLEPDLVLLCQSNSESCLAHARVITP